MTEFFKKNLIALRHCLLYEFLKNKSVDDASSDLCAAFGEDIFNKEEVYTYFRQFNRGIFEDGAKPVTDMRKILRNDKKALRVCVMYEWLTTKREKSVKRTISSNLKNELLPVFVKYENFCKVFGKYVMNYREFDFWFYRFVNGDFDLNFERNKDEKIYELMDMPLDIMRNIVHYLDIVDRLSLEKTSQSLRLFSQDQKLFHGDLRFDVHENSASIDFGNSGCISYTNEGNDCLMEFRNRKKVLRGVSFLKQAFQDFKKIIGNPKLYVNTLTISSLCKDSELFGKCIEDALKFTHLLHVQHLSLRTFYMNPLLIILPLLTPGYLATIDMDISSEKALIGELVEMNQWKQAKHLDMRYHLFVGPLRHLYHFKEFTVTRQELFIDDVREMKKILLKSPNFEGCTLYLQSSVDPIAIRQVFSGPIEGSVDTCHYPIPSSTEYFEIFVSYTIMKIKKKKK